MAKLPALETLILRYSDPVVKKEVVLRLRPMVLKYAKKYALGAHELLDELVAVGLTGLAIALPRWRADGGANVRNWCQYEVNHQMRKLRGAYERQRLEHPYVDDDENIRGDLEDMASVALSASTSSPNPEQALQYKERREQVWAQVERHPDITSRQRSAMRAVYGRGLTTLQASRLLGCSDETVRQELRRAVKVLKGALCHE